MKKPGKHKSPAFEWLPTQCCAPPLSLLAAPTLPCDYKACTCSEGKAPHLSPPVNPGCLPLHRPHMSILTTHCELSLELWRYVLSCIISLFPPDTHKSNNRTLAPTDREIIPSQELRFGITLETCLLCQVFPELPSFQQ